MLAIFVCVHLFVNIVADKFMLISSSIDVTVFTACSLKLIKGQGKSIDFDGKMAFTKASCYLLERNFSAQDTSKNIGLYEK